MYSNFFVCVLCFSKFWNLFSFLIPITIHQVGNVNIFVQQLFRAVVSFLNRINFLLEWELISFHRTHIKMFMRKGGHVKIRRTPNFFRSICVCEGARHCKIRDFFFSRIRILKKMYATLFNWLILFYKNRVSRS